MLMLVVPIWRDHKIFGIDLSPKSTDENSEALSILQDGTVIVNTSELCKDIKGYGGPTPIEIVINDGVIQEILPLENQETPEFYGAVVNSDIFDSFVGKTLEEAADVKVDGVSGATYSSNATIENIHAGIRYALAADNIHVAPDTSREDLPLKFYITLVIILCGGLVPLWLKDKRYRILQLVLNVLLLGFWGGTFISYSLMMSYLTNGITKVVLIPTALMLVAAFIYPLFGRVDHYCNWMCPYGSLQELLGRCVKYKVKMGERVIRYLTLFREFLWFVLMWLLWTGLWFDWMGYEPFAAFFFKDASIVTLCIAGGFLIISLFVNRPYCRFVCPTGTLFKFSEGSR